MGKELESEPMRPENDAEWSAGEDTESESGAEFKTEEKGKRMMDEGLSEEERKARLEDPTRHRDLK